MKKRFYFPLTVTLYESDDYGNLDWNSPCELDGRYANDFQSEIEEKFESYTKDDIEDMATYFHGSEKVAAKLKSMKWGFESIGDKLFGRVDLIASEELTPDEVEEVKSNDTQLSIYVLIRNFCRNQTTLSRTINYLKNTQETTPITY